MMDDDRECSWCFAQPVMRWLTVVGQDVCSWHCAGHMAAPGDDAKSCRRCAW